MKLAAFLPIDRYHSLLSGTALVEHSQGAALFADISGFTPLTETLTKELGSRLGSEELTRNLNQVYEQLIAQVHLFHGSVISFSGDAITCWFESAVSPDQSDNLAPASHLALSAALAMQQALQKVACITTPAGQQLELKLKVAVVAGAARRFMVGDPQFQRLDILAGTTFDRLAHCEKLAVKGEVVASTEIIEQLTGQGLTVETGEWREETSAGCKIAVINSLTPLARPDPWPLLANPVGEIEATLREWVLDLVYQHCTSGLDDFLTELRPTTALFLKFEGLDYDHDPLASVKLNHYICRVQQVVNQFGGNLLEIIVGDKGSYIYCTFGALVAYQNSSERAARTALELLALSGRAETELEWLRPVQIGLSQGTMRVGLYGSQSRHNYGVLGEEVNIAARLMQAAKPGQILISSRIYNELNPANLKFEVEALPALKVKGKAEPLGVFALKAYIRPTLKHFPRPVIAPLIGRQNELATALTKIELARSGKGQLIALMGEAGIGKSRLLEELCQLARSNPALLSYSGECLSYATNSPYSVWQHIFRGFFGLQEGQKVEQQIRQVSERLAELDPVLLNRLPLLNPILNLPIPDNNFTANIQDKLKKELREALVIDLLKVICQIRGGATLMLILEDCHWLDPLSHDLMEMVGRAITALPVAIILTYRPPELEHL
jgi:class 3 adenylate cyclase